MVTKCCFFLLLFVSVSGYCQNSVTQGERIDLQDPAEISVLSSTVRSFESARNRTGECAGGDSSKRMECVCENRQAWNDFNDQLTAMLKQYPLWNDKFLDYQEGLSGAGTSVKALLGVNSHIKAIECK